MRLGVLLTLCFLLLASLVGWVAYLFWVSSEEVRLQIDDLRSGSITEVEGATGMALALQASQVAAQELIAERYRSRSEASHESEWNVAGDIDLDAIDDTLDEFEEGLEQSRRANEVAIALLRRRQDPSAVGEEAERLSRRLGRVEREYGVYLGEVDRFVHLTRYHPTDHVQEYMEEVLRPHYREVLLPLIRDYQEEAQDALVTEVSSIEGFLSLNNRRNRGIAALAGLGALLLGLLLSRHIGAPLTRLAGWARRVGRGELSEPLKISGSGEVGVLIEAFGQMQDDLQQTTVSRSYLDNILSSMGEFLWVTDADGEIQRANPAACAASGWSEEELVGRRVGDLLADAEDGEARWSFLDTDLLTRDGERLPVSCSRTPLREGPDGGAGEIFVARDIRHRREAEDKLRRSLGEKEVLLQEVHHRVKNNLQIVSSLLSLQEPSSDPEAARRILESQNRIQSMALIHEQLYRSEDLTRIDFGGYLRRLVDSVVTSYGPQGREIAVEVDVAATELDLDSAIPCGLIATELVTNAIEHAYPGDREGTVRVEFGEVDGSHRLAVVDDGAGFPPDVDERRSGSLGLQLVDALVQQINGTLTLSVGNEGVGAVAEVRFRPLPSAQEMTT